jgi:ribosomal protein S6--L-glutamate ligase
MNIAILSRQPKSYSTDRLRKAGKERGHKVRIMDTLRFSMQVEHGNPDMYFEHKPLPKLDAVIPRIGASITFFGVAVVKQFEEMGIYTANESLAIRSSRDKLRAMQILSRYDVGLPTTIFVRDKAEIMPSIERIGGPPVIIKLLEGTQGVGVILAETSKMAEAIIQALHSANQNVLIQKFVKESGGSDVRAFVVGDRVVAAMKRKAAKGEFRSNVHRGGTTEVLELSEEYERTAVRAAQILGLRIAGVDMLESNSGPQVLEVNSSPGLEGIETATGIDVAGEIIADIESNVLFPQVDLKQRLRLAGGFGLVEFDVHKMPELERKALREAPLQEKDIHVMSISRDNGVVTNPKGNEIIYKGDRLLCFGPLHELRNFATRGKRRTKKKPKSE